MKLISKAAIASLCLGLSCALTPAQAAPTLGSPLVNVSQCAGLPPFLAYGGNMTVAPDRKIYFTSALTGGVYVVDDSGQCSLYSQLPPQLSPGFFVGITSDKLNNLYVVSSAANDLGGPGLVYKIDADDPANPTVLWKNTQPGALITVISHDGRGKLYISDETAGRLFKIDDTDNGDSTGDFTWVSSPELAGVSTPSPCGIPPNSTNPPAPANGTPCGDPTNTNLLGVPFGVTGTTVDRRGKYLYFVNHEKGTLGRIEINKTDGSAGAVQRLVNLNDANDLINAQPVGAACEGLFFDQRKKVLYISAVFRNPSNVNQVDSGHIVYKVDIKKINSNGGTDNLKAEVVLDDVQLGESGSVVSGFKFGKGNKNKLYVMDTAFGHFFGWTFARYTNGIKTGNQIPFTYDPPNIPNLQDPNTTPPQDLIGPFAVPAAADSKINVINLD